MAACGHGPAIPVDRLPLLSPKMEIIRVGDHLDVHVDGKGGKPFSVKKGLVLGDGKLYLPVVGGEPVVGLTLLDAGKNIAQRLLGQVEDAKVVVSFSETKIQVAVLGEVSAPGMQSLPGGVGVLHALAAAKGFSLYANRDRILVIRKDGPTQQPILFTYRALVRGEGNGPAFVLKDGDVVVVE